MNFMETGSFYGELAKEKAIGESLAKRIQGISSEAELQKLIQDEILPLARKMGYDFSEKDFFEYERTVSQRLSDEDLLNVTGGFFKVCAAVWRNFLSGDAWLWSAFTGASRCDGSKSGS